ncbi:MAG: RNA polymerase sigma factor [Kofleriaceae bacterium]|nr:RNA polymerase sigma factor [Kofleriaceae bacterium]
MTSEKRFEHLLAPHHDLVRGYIHRLVGHSADAEDVLQDVLVKALEKLPTLRKDSAFRAWIMRIATSTSLDYLRMKKRWRPLSQSYVEQECAENLELRAEVVEVTKDPEFAFDVREHIAFCFTCVARSLPPEQEAAIVLREILSFTNREAADVMELTESAVRHRLSDGRRGWRRPLTDCVHSLVRRACAINVQGFAIQPPRSDVGRYCQCSILITICGEQGLRRRKRSTSWMELARLSTTCFFLALLGLNRR